MTVEAPTGQIPLENAIYNDGISQAFDLWRLAARSAGNPRDGMPNPPTIEGLDDGSTTYTTTDENGLKVALKKDVDYPYGLANADLKKAVISASIEFPSGGLRIETGEIERFTPNDGSPARFRSFPEPQEGLVPKEVATLAGWTADTVSYAARCIIEAAGNPYGESK